MAGLTKLPEALEEAASALRASSAPRDESYEELAYAIDLALAASYRFNAETLERLLTQGGAEAPAKPRPLVLVASR